jgi:hypothetical protein
MGLHTKLIISLAQIRHKIFIDKLITKGKGKRDDVTGKWRKLHNEA